MLVCGIDEAGRGPIAGPVTAADIMESFRMFQGRVTDNYMRLVEEYGLSLSEMLNL